LQLDFFLVFIVKELPPAEAILLLYTLYGYRKLNLK
jgi:hypothetical protein